MLVLSRKKNESIVVNNNVTITVVEIRGDKVRLGIEAPKDIPVHRSEIHDQIKRSKQMCETSTSEDQKDGGLLGLDQEPDAQRVRPNQEKLGNGGD